MERVYLSRCNIEALLSKLNRKAQGEETTCTIIKRDKIHPVYPQTMDILSVIAVEYGQNTYLKHINTLEINRALLDKFTTLLNTTVHAVVIINGFNGLEINALENEVYYTDRVPGEIYYKDIPNLS